MGSPTRRASTRASEGSRDRFRDGGDSDLEAVGAACGPPELLKLAAEQNRAALTRYALDDRGWKAYLAARDQRRLTQPGLLRQVRVIGGDPNAQHQVLAARKPLEGQPITPAATIDALRGAKAVTLVLNATTQRTRRQKISTMKRSS